jgi:hypothetical protein
MSGQRREPPSQSRRTVRRSEAAIRRALRMRGGGEDRALAHATGARRGAITDGQKMTGVQSAILSSLESTHAGAQQFSYYWYCHRQTKRGLSKVGGWIDGYTAIISGNILRGMAPKRLSLLGEQLNTSSAYSLESGCRD